MRELVFDDVYKMAEILKSIKIDVSDEELANSDNSMVRGVTIFKNVIGNSSTAKKEINEFLGSLFGISGDEFGKLPFIQSMKCIKQFKEIEGFEDFFNSVKDLAK